MRRQWEVRLQREGFTASDHAKICSDHFREEDFDRTGQTVRIREGVIPSIFPILPLHPQRVGVSLEIYASQATTYVT